MDIGDLIMCTSFVEQVQVEPHYDTTFSMAHWIKHWKFTMGLSNKDMNSLFQDVIFHPSFSLDEVNVGSIIDLERYEQ
jgi:hypothetical protein